MSFNPDVNEVYFKGTPEAINKIVDWWKNESGQELGKDIQIIDVKPNIKEYDD